MVVNSALILNTHMPPCSKSAIFLGQVIMEKDFQNLTGKQTTIMYSQVLTLLILQIFQRWELVNQSRPDKMTHACMFLNLKTIKGAMRYEEII